MPRALRKPASTKSTTARPMRLRIAPIPIGVEEDGVGGKGFGSRGFRGRSDRGKGPGRHRSDICQRSPVGPPGIGPAPALFEISLDLTLICDPAALLGMPPLDPLTRRQWELLHRGNMAPHRALGVPLAGVARQPRICPSTALPSLREHERLRVVDRHAGMARPNPVGWRSLAERRGHCRGPRRPFARSPFPPEEAGPATRELEPAVSRAAAEGLGGSPWRPERGPRDAPPAPCGGPVRKPFRP